MKVKVQNENGTCFSYDTAKVAECVAPSASEKVAVLRALREAISSLSPVRNSQLAQPATEQS